MTITYYLTRPKAESETSIFARISYNGFQLKYYTPERINPKYWNNKTHRAKETQKFREYPEFNQRLDNFAADIKNAFRTWVNNHEGTIPAPSTLREVLDKELQKEETKKEVVHTFFSFYEEFISRSLEGARVNIKTKKGTVYNTTKGYISTLKHLKEFQKTYKLKIDFPTIDLEFYYSYVRYLTQTIKLSTNTIGDHIKRIKTVMNEATEKGINTNLAFRSKYFAKPGEEAQSIYLTNEELKKLEELDLSKKPTLEKVRDLFLIGCYSGLRYSDYSILRPEQMKDGFIETKQIKTGASVVIPIHSTVKKILDKYKGSLPRAISNQKTNEYLKDIGKTVPEGKNDPILNETVSKSITKGSIKVTQNFKKWELLTTHTARRSFATNEYLAGTPTVTIMAITGHKTEKAFLKYIKLTPNEHARILKSYWQQRQDQFKLEAV